MRIPNSVHLADYLGLKLVLTKTNWIVTRWPRKSLTAKASVRWRYSCSNSSRSKTHHPPNLHNKQSRMEWTTNPFSAAWPFFSHLTWMIRPMAVKKVDPSAARITIQRTKRSSWWTTTTWSNRALPSRYDQMSRTRCQRHGFSKCSKLNRRCLRRTMCFLVGICPVAPSAASSK